MRSARGRRHDDAPVPAPVTRGRLRLLQLTTFTSSLDRASIAPMLLLIARDLHQTVDQVTLVATSYFFAYGVMQLVWAVVSEHLGRVRTMRLALVLAGTSGLVSVFAPSLEVLLISRTIAGATFAAAVPGALIYVGDMLPMERRHPVLADLATGTALGLTIGTVGAAVVADQLGWRVTFALTAVAAGVLASLIGRLPEPPRRFREPLLDHVPALLRNRRALLVLGLAWLEGFTVLGFLVFMPTVLQVQGAGTTLSGLVVAVYGVAVVLGAAVVKHLAGRLRAARIVAAGGTCLVAAFLLLVVTRGPVAVLIACALLGSAWASLHTSLQAWATDVAPHARALVVSAFAAMLFVGNAAGSFVGGVILAGPGRQVLFVLPAVVGVPLAVLATVGRSRHVTGPSVG